jgi:hypothetical protein
LPNLLRAFDFASPDQSSAERPRTTVPQQALFMLNSPFVIDQAKELAASIPSSATEAFVRGVYHRVLARDPTDEEERVGAAFLQGNASGDSTSSLTPREQFAQLILLTNEFLFVD